MFVKTIFILFLAIMPIIDSLSAYKPWRPKSECKKVICDSQNLSPIFLTNEIVIQVSTTYGNHIGYIHDVYKPSMNIPKGSVLQITQKQKINTDEFVRIFYDENHEGLSSDLHVSKGKYLASEISLPKRSVSSIIIPEGYQVILYTYDDFKGDFIILSSSKKNFYEFNDKMVSLEIKKKYEEDEKHVAFIFSNGNYEGIKTGLEIGKSIKIESNKIGSIMVHPGTEIFIYDGDILTDIYTSNIESVPSPYTKCELEGLKFWKIEPEKRYEFTATVQVKATSGSPSEFATFYENVDFKGSHFTLFEAPIILNKTDGKLSSLKIPMNHEVVLYEKENMEGAYVILTGDIPNLNIYLFNDRAMSIIFRKNQQTEPIGYVEIFSIYNKRILPIGYSNISNEDFYANSIKVPQGLKVTLQKNPIFPLFLERKYTYTSDYTNTNTQNLLDSKLISVFVEEI
jgi:hypothetical protein